MTDRELRDDLYRRWYERALTCYQEWVDLDRLWQQCCAQDGEAAHRQAEENVRSYRGKLPYTFLVLFLLLAAIDLLYWVGAAMVNGAAWHTNYRLWEVPHSFLLLLGCLLGAALAFFFLLRTPQVQKEREKEVLLRRDALLGIPQEELPTTDWATVDRRQGFENFRPVLTTPTLPRPASLPSVVPPALPPGASYPAGSSRQWFVERLQKQGPPPGVDEEAERLQGELIRLDARQEG